MEFIMETEIECGSAVDLYSKDLMQNQLWFQGYVCMCVFDCLPQFIQFAPHFTFWLKT